VHQFGPSSSARPEICLLTAGCPFHVTLTQRRSSLFNDPDEHLHCSICPQQPPIPLCNEFHGERKENPGKTIILLIEMHSCGE